MPSDPLLLAFALTLVVNAVIVVIAIRALREGTTETTETTYRPAPVATPTPVRPRARLAADVDPSRAAVATADRPEAEAASTPAPPDPVTDPTEAEPEPTRPTAPEPPIPAEASPPKTGSKSGRKTTGRRRKFSLPPLDDDHEKVSRSIETFLGVADDAAPAAPTPQAAPTPPAVTPAADANAPVAVVTVAVIQLEGPGPHDLLERTVRSTARAADEVTIDRRGRVRVVLPGTGEVAAKAYLRRIRSIVDPIAEATEPPSRIVIATATEIDGGIAAARRRADRRLAVALGQPATPADAEPDRADDGRDELREPRAAGD